MSDVVTVSNRNGVAIVTLQNPPVNGLGFAVRTELEAALRTATDDDTVQALVITGDGKEVHRKRIDLSGTGPFGKRALSETLDLTGKFDNQFRKHELFSVKYDPIVRTKLNVVERMPKCCRNILLRIPYH